MNEMLANQYFLTRNWKTAAQELETVHKQHPELKAIRKKLIICYIELGMFKKAYKLFNELVMEDIDFIMNTDVVKECCPCPDLIFKYENEIQINGYNKTLTMAMLWLYCDVRKSLDYFKELESKQNFDINISEIIPLLNKTISNQMEDHDGNKKANQK